MNPLFRSHILSKVMIIFTSQTSITENGNRLNSLYWYKTIVRCKHLVARIFQRGFKLSSWMQVNKISNQIVYHQSATKFASMLQDITKNYKPVKLLKYLLHFWFCVKKKNNNILTILTRTDWLIISILNTVIEKFKAWKTDCEDRRVAG